MQKTAYLFDCNFAAPALMLAEINVEWKTEFPGCGAIFTADLAARPSIAQGLEAASIASEFAEDFAQSVFCATVPAMCTFLKSYDAQFQHRHRNPNAICSTFDASQRLRRFAMLESAAPSYLSFECAGPA